MPERQQKARPNRKRDIVSLLIAVALLTALALYARSYDVTVESIRAQAAIMGGKKTFIFISLLYGLISVAPVPGRDIFKIVAAVLFGWLASTACIWIGELLAAVAAFWTARLGGRPVTVWFLGRQAEMMDKAAIKFSPGAVFVARILPITPYRYFNFACGVTAMPFGNYMYGSIPGTLARTAFFQYLFVKGGDYLLSENVGLTAIFIFGIVLATAMVAGWALWARAKGRKEG